MRRALLFSALALATVVASRTGFVAWKQSQLRSEDHPGWNADHTAFRLPNGWAVSPAGRSVLLPGDMPVAILPDRDSNSAVVSTAGYHGHSVSVVNLSTDALESTIGFDRSWTGLAESRGGELLVSAGKPQGRGDLIYRVSRPGSLQKEPGIDVPSIPANQKFVSGITVDRSGNIFALNIQSDEILKLDPEGHLIRSAKVGYRPYGVALMPGEREIVVSNWGDKSISFLDADSLRKLRTVRVGERPDALAVDPSGRVFVANGGDMTVAAVSSNGEVENIRAGGLHRPVGSTPDALALDPSGRTLYVADAGINAVVVVDVSQPEHSRVEGMIPTDRYPSALAVTPDGKRLLIGTAKGTYGPNADHSYIGNQLAGRLAILDIPNHDQLRNYTTEVLKNADHAQTTLITAAERRQIEHTVLPRIHHVVYILKENRTYDQVFGDISKGEGDPSITMFGEAVTPNEHKLVDDFSLLDNLYTDGEVSQCGHQWSDAGYASDYCEKQWVLSYAKKGEVESDKRLFASPGDYIWTLARKHGRTAKVYGEYVNLQEDHSDANPQIAGHLEELGFSEAFDRAWKKGARDPEKVDLFLADMRKAEKDGKWWNFMEMALPEDHTRGLSPGRNSPRAMVASNDQAVGRLIEGISHSKFWNDTAIFIIEDDAQDGADHVDSHRTTGLVISPYVRRNVVDSTHYTTSSMLRTMELILGLPPMTEFDATATPILASFTAHPDFAAYDPVAPKVNVNELNPESGELEARSAKLDFSSVDRADPTELNHILWEAYKPGVPYPARVSTGYLGR